MVVSNDMLEVVRKKSLEQVVRKDVLMFGEDLNELSELLKPIGELGFRRIGASRTEITESLLQSIPHFAAILVDARQTSFIQACAFVERVKEQAIVVPVVWLGGVDDEPMRDSLYRPDLVIKEPFGPSEVLQSVTQVLTNRLFPAEIHTCFETSIMDSLLDNFNCPVEHIESEMRSDPLPLGSISAMVSLVSSELCGALVVSADNPFFERGFKNLLPENTSPDGVDFAGEMANTIAGRLKSQLFKFGCRVQHAFPLVVQGHPISLAYGSLYGTSLLKHIDTQWGRVSVELYLDWVDAEQIREENNEKVEEAQDEGTLEFF